MQLASEGKKDVLAGSIFSDSNKCDNAKTVNMRCVYKKPLENQRD